MEKSGKEEGMEGMVVILQKVSTLRGFGRGTDRPAPARATAPLGRPGRHPTYANTHTHTLAHEHK